MPSVQKFILKGNLSTFLVLVEPSGKTIIKERGLNYVGKAMIKAPYLERGIEKLNSQTGHNFSKEDLEESLL